MSESGFDFQPPPEPISRSNKTENFINTLKKENISSKVIPINVEGFSEAIILNPDENPSNEKMIRVYRGVSRLDETVLNQVPYAMKIDSDKKYGESVLNNQDVKQSVDDLAENPTYTNFLDYINIIEPFLEKNQKQWYHDSLSRIEKDILQGDSLLSNLRIDHYSFAAGAGMSGYSPYISMALTPDMANEFAFDRGHQSGILVMEVPSSKLEILFGPDNNEVEYKGCLDQKYIKAIIVKDTTSKEKTVTNPSLIQKTIGIVDKEIKGSIYSPDELTQFRNQQWQERLKNDENQKLIDKQAVEQEKFKRLFSKLTDFKIDPKTLETENNVYYKYMDMAYDFYDEKLRQLGFDHLPDKKMRPDITVTEEKLLWMQDNLNHLNNETNIAA